MRAGRNPRRAYDEYGNGIPPATVWNKVARGYKTVMALMPAGAAITPRFPSPAFPPNFPISDIALRLHCSRMRRPGHQDHAQRQRAPRPLVWREGLSRRLRGKTMGGRECQF